MDVSCDHVEYQEATQICYFYTSPRIEVHGEWGDAAVTLDAISDASCRSSCFEHDQECSGFDVFKSISSRRVWAETYDDAESCESRCSDYGDCSEAVWDSLVPGGPVQCVLCIMNPITCCLCFQPVEKAKSAAKSASGTTLAKYGLCLKFDSDLEGEIGIIGPQWGQ